MEKEEAIKEIKNASDEEVRYGDIEHHYEDVMKRVEAFEMAIEALEQKPCEDCISRKDVLNQIFYSTDNSGDVVLGSELRSRIERLPSVTPQEPRWIPVSERLPKAFEYVNCTCHSLIDDREDWVVETCYIPQPQNSPYSDWGNIPMLNHGECEVVAWMYREIPEPYKAESEVKE